MLVELVDLDQTLRSGFAVQDFCRFLAARPATRQYEVGAHRIHAASSSPTQDTAR